MNENNSDVLYYDGYTKFTVPRVRDNQYNPMIVGEREELFNNILDSIDKKQTSPKYDDLFYVEGKNIDVGGGVEYRGMLSHSDDDYTKVNILCELQDKNTGNVLKSFEKDLIIDYSDFMDSYGIESDIEDYILEELKKYMIGVLAQYDPKYKKENRTMRELKRSRKFEENRRYYESLSNSDVKEIMNNLREQNTSNKLDSGNFRLSEALNLFQKLLDEKDKGYPYNSDLDVFYKFKKAGYKSASDLISDITGAVNRRIRELTQVKNDLEELKHIAISFDIRPGHH